MLITYLQLLLLLLAIAIIKEVIVHLNLPELVKNIDDDNYGSFDKFALMQKYFYGVLGLTLIICWIKLIKFFTMFSTVAILFIAIGKVSYFGLVIYLYDISVFNFVIIFMNFKLINFFTLPFRVNCIYWHCQ